MKKINLSIITISLDNKDLKKTVNSVRAQMYDSPLFEHIVIEGSLKSKNKLLLTEYSSTALHKTICVCEKDTGRYNAMNKGINLAKGKYILFLNAGDTLHKPTTLSKVFSKKHNKDLLYGDIDTSKLGEQILSKKFFIAKNLHHQATFIKRTVFDLLGNYSEKYQIASDFEFWLRYFATKEYNTSYEYLPYTISKYDVTGISSTELNKLYSERAQIISRYFGGYTKIYHLIKFFYYKFRQVLKIES